MAGESHEVHLLLGRVDGKVDIVIANQSAQYLKLEQLSSRVSNTETRLTTIETFDASKKSNKALWFTTIGIITALATALFNMYRSFAGY